MELSASINPWLHVSGAFLQPVHCPLFVNSQADHQAMSEDPNTSPTYWACCASNPLNKLDKLNLDRIPQSLWRIDGCSSNGTQFFVLPIGLSLKILPLRIDVFIPDQAKHPPALRRILESSAAFAIRDRRVNRLGISKYILQVLDIWSAKYDLAKICRLLPFGSRIAIDRITSSLADVRLHILPNLKLAEQLLSVQELQDLWGLEADGWPSSVDITDMEQHSQLSDAISVVQIPGLHGDRFYIFKSSTSDYRYIYHELKLLLTMPPHRNVISKPAHIATGLTVSGEVKVHGFVLDYYQGGNLATALAKSSEESVLGMGDKIRWAKQVITALIHVSTGPARYYSELKPDNIILTESGQNLVLIDFEQHANWEAFSAPEIRHVNNLQHIVASGVVPESKRHRYSQLVHKHLTIDTATFDGNDYTNPPCGYFHSWNILSPGEQEAAMVYALGKLLWCIFEEVNHTRNSISEEYGHPSSIEFPRFHRTPPRLRELIEHCTAGSEHWIDADLIEIRCAGGFMYPAKGLPSHTDRAREAVEAAHAMAVQRLCQMEDYLAAWSRWQIEQASENDVHLIGFPLRPTLRKVLDTVLEEEREQENSLPGAHTQGCSSG